jgi:hypothetical protein
MRRTDTPTHATIKAEESVGASISTRSIEHRFHPVDGDAYAA